MTKGRERPWHRGVTREVLVREALRILDADGRAALTMRRLGSAVGVEAPSLYAHIRSKDELFDAVIDAVLDDVTLPPDDDDVRASLAAGFRAYRRALLAHPAVVGLVVERARLSGGQVRLIRRSIDLLERAGLSTREAVDAHVTLVAYVLGFLVQEVSRPSPPSTSSPPDPVLATVLATVAERSVDDRFEAGLAVILDGIGLSRR